jgi:hypothetical protein
LALSESEARYTFDMVSRKRGAELFNRFYAAKQRLEQDFGASISLVRQENGPIKVAAMMEFLTRDRSIDEDMDYAVRAAGFMLSLKSRPLLELPEKERYQANGRFIEHSALGKDGLSGLWLKPVYELKMERVYAIREREYASAELQRAAASAEALYALLERTLKLPKIPQDLPENVILLDSKRPPPPEAKSGIHDKPDAPARHAAKVS